MNKSNFRALTDEEVANCVKLIRHDRKWSQEQLAAISGLNLRTIQRVEKGEPSSIDTRRNLANSFGANDIDAFNKETYIPSMDELKKYQDYIEDSCEQIKATKLNTSFGLLDATEGCHASFFDSSFDMSHDAEEANHLIKCYLKEYMDCHDLYNKEQKNDAAKEIQVHIDKLNKLGVALVYAKKKTNITNIGNNISMETIYIIAFPIGKEPDTLIIPNEADVSV